jgi:argininosuccinate synthase
MRSRQSLGLAAPVPSTTEPALQKVVLAYSGGLDTSVAVAWLQEQYDVDVVTLTVDVGGGSLRPGAADRAISAGATRAYVVDARRTFVEGFVWPALRAGAIYQGAYPLATALARPLIAELLVAVAHAEGADTVAHGCTGKGNDQVRFDVAVKALDPRLGVVAPMRVGMGMTREQEIEYAIERGIDIPVTKASPYSVDVNLWGRSVETGVLEDPWVTPPADAYQWTVAPADAPPPVEVTIAFDGGTPVSLDGAAVDPVELVEGLNALAGSHGVGRIDHVEDRLVGIKSREIYEAPAAVVLHAAHRALEGLTLSKDQLRFGRLLADEVAQATYDGLWFTRLQTQLREFVAAAQQVVTGEVRMQLDHGTASIAGRRSPSSLYDRALATYDQGDAFDHASAVGFISIFGLPLRTEAARSGAVAKPEQVLAALPVEVVDATESPAKETPVAVGG